jgi:hypothetical protein
MFVSGTCGMRVPICMLILCVMTPGLSLPCSAKRRAGGSRGSKKGARWPDMGVECAVQGGCRGFGAARHSSDPSSIQKWRVGEGCGRVREEGRVGRWADQGGDR